jgi:peptidase A4-like protein
VKFALVGRAWAVSALVLAFGSAPATTPAQALMFHRPIVKVGANQSNNWSGYNQGTLEKGGVQFHSVDGTWVVPTATQHAPGEAEFSASWVGIGGGCVDAGCTITDSTLIQAGTSQDVDASGHAAYSAWWEIIPAPSTTIVNFAVSAGNVIHVNITETTPAIWSITVQNQTTGQTFAMTTPYTSTYSTAEWIEETPVVIDSSGTVTIGPMPTLSTVNFDHSLTNGKAPGLSASEEIQLVDSNRAPLATPSAPDADSDGFNVCSFTGSCGVPAS